MVLKEYIVTLKNKKELDGFYAEMESSGIFEFIPDREVFCINRRPISRNTHYLLSADEAEKLSEDPRVESVTLCYKELGLKVISYAEQTANFNRSDAMALGYKNWGLYRSVNEINDEGWSDGGGSSDKNATINIIPTASNVDVVVVDEILYPDHSEYTGRAEQYDWFNNYDTQVRGTGCQIVRVERSTNVARITTKTAHGLAAGNIVNVVCSSNGTFNVTSASVIDVSATPVGSGGDGVTVNRFRYSNNGTTISLTSKAISSIARASNIATVICSTSHGLTTGDTVGVNISTSGYSSFATSGVSVTVINATTFTYANTGSVITTVSVTGNVFLDDASGSWTGTYLYNNYSSGNNHATVIGGIIAGSTQGWARGATLYNLRHDYNSIPANNFVPLEYVFDYVRYWHADKAVDPITGYKRPTLLNCSWGVGISTTSKNLYTGNLKTNISEVSYRGSTIRPEDLGNSKLDTGFTGVCSGTAVVGELRGSQTSSTTANVTINAISSQATGSAIVPISSLTGTINVGDYMNCNASGWIAGARVTSVVDNVTSYVLTVNFLKPVTVTGTSTATCTFYSSTIENVGFSVTTTGSAAATVSSIAVSLGGNSGMTDLGAPTASSTNGVDIYDDAVWACELPFNIQYLTGNYGPDFAGAPPSVGDDRYINVSTNGFVTFGGGLSNGYTYLVDPTGPATRKICISAGDRSARKCYTQTTGTSGSRTFRIRYEGHEAANGGSAASPTVIWEIKFFEATPTTFQIHVGANAVYKGEFEQSQLLDYGIDLNSNTAPQKNAAIDADIADCIAEGILIVGSAGNQNYKIDVGGGLDYNNHYIVNGIPYYYHRGSSPGASTDVICVGALNSSGLENKSNESNAGPRVDLYAPGVNIASSVYNNQGPGIGGTGGTVRDNTNTVAMSTAQRASNGIATITTSVAHGLTTGDLITISDCSNINYNVYMAVVTVTGTTTFTCNVGGSSVIGSASVTGTVLPGYFFQKYSGTSIAAAQVSGVLALALETYPGMSQTTAKQYITGYAKSNLMYDTAGGYTDLSSLQGGPNRILYYNVERKSTGSVFPKLNYQIRPTSGAVFPRTRIRKS